MMSYIVSLATYMTAVAKGKCVGSESRAFRGGFRNDESYCKEKRRRDAVDDRRLPSQKSPVFASLEGCESNAHEITLTPLRVYSLKDHFSDK